MSGFAPNPFAAGVRAMQRLSWTAKLATAGIPIVLAQGLSAGA